MHDHIQFVAITFHDGSLGVMQLLRAPRTDRGFQRVDMTDEYISREIGRSCFSATPVSWRRIRFEDLPADASYRDAWADRCGLIMHDMTKAREIHRARLRKLRAPLLAALDVEYQRADEKADSSRKRLVAERKQALRDATSDPRIEAAQTIEDLAKVGLPTDN